MQNFIKLLTVTQQHTEYIDLNACYYHIFYIFKFLLWYLMGLKVPIGSAHDHPRSIWDLCINIREHPENQAA